MTLLRPLRVFTLVLFAGFGGSLAAQPLVENLGRGVVATHQADGKVFVSWRLLANDPDGVAFNVYRTTSGVAADVKDFGEYASRPDTPLGTVKLNAAPLTAGTWFLDTAPALQHATSYVVKPVVGGVEGPASEVTAAASFKPFAAPLPYRVLPLKTPEGYTPGDTSAGDLDGDGEYELIVKQEQKPLDNSRSGRTGETLLQAYKLDGTLLWTINLGKNIREGAHYTQFMVCDFDGDGRAELACKTADGTVDGVGKVIGDAKAYYPNAAGHIVSGPEFFTVFDGRTGAALATTDFVPARHPTNPLNPSVEELHALWGDGKGNRSERYLAGVAYLDGKLPSIIMARGYYTRTVVTAWDWRGGQLTRRWTFDSDDGKLGHREFRGQGYHSLSVADVDGDGRDEIVYGSMVLDDNGEGLYSTGWGHGDALHVSDFVPSNPGLEVLGIQERFDKQGMHLRDAKTGKLIFAVPSVKADETGGDRGEGPGRGVSFNIDPRYPGAEAWAIGAGITGVFSAAGERIFERQDMPANFAVWWDGDLLRELLDQNFIAKWNWETGRVDRLLTAHECLSSNGTKATPALSLDLYGDWREEVVWVTRDHQALHIYSTTIPTPHRIVTLMHDPQYRVAIAWQNTAYNQPPHPSFALDPALPLPAKPRVVVREAAAGAAR